jgi:hypothetical protein
MDDPRMAEGNWHPFPPPPDAAFYDLRQIVGKDGNYRAYYYNMRRVYQGKGQRWMTMNRRISKMEPKAGWQFRFLDSSSHWRPHVVLYNTTGGKLVRTGTRDLTGQLPVARSNAEAHYLVRMIPIRWPIYWHLHVEFSEEKLQ